jgi:hypothetical protein
MRKFWLATILFAMAASPVRAQIVINEVSSFSNPEWVELYNTSSSSAILKEHTIDFGSDSQKKSFCESEQISPYGYKLIILSSSWLNNAGDVVNLKNGDDLIDNIGYGTGYPLTKPNSASESITRSPDGSANWITTQQQSQQGDTVSFDCPSPPASPNPSPSHTPSPNPSPTPSPSLGSSPTPKRSPKPSLSPSLNTTEEEKQGTVAGATTEINLSGFGASPSPLTVAKPSKNKLSLNHSRAKTALLVGLGLILISVAGFLGYRKYLSSKQSDV